MRYEELLQVTARYPVSDQAYAEAIQSLKWGQAQFDIGKNIIIIEKFLTDWRSTRGGLPDRQKFATVWMRDVEPYASHLEGETIENLEIDKVFEAGDEKLRIGTAIEHMFGALMALPTVGETNASKILHLRLPNLIVMTDGEVRGMWKERAGSKSFSPHGYAFRFHRFVRAELMEAIFTLSHAKGFSEYDSIDFLRKVHGRQRSLAKLADEYYYCKTR